MSKPTKWHVHPAKTQISLGIRPVWSESSLSAWRKLGSLATHWAHSEDSDQTGQMSRLIWVVAGRTVILLVLSWGGSHVWSVLLSSIKIKANRMKIYKMFLKSSDVWHDQLSALAKDFHTVINEPLWENLFLPYANKGAAQPVHLCSLISAFVIRCLDSITHLPITRMQNRDQYRISIRGVFGLALEESKKHTFSRI